jgi:solute:Na+ symporter, SSS family
MQGGIKVLEQVGFGSVNWTIFIIYLVGIFALGSMFMGRQTSTDEFFRASKRMGWLIIMLSLMASTHSGAGFMSHPARVFKSDAVVLVAGYISGFFVFPMIAYVLLPFYRRLDVTTAYQYLEKRFGLNTRLLASCLFILQRILWMALVVLAPSLALSVILGLRVEFCILLVGLAATIYTALGGMSAVMWTDVVQFIVLTIGEVLIFVVVVFKLEGGFMEIINVAVADNKIISNFAWDPSQATFWTLLISGCILGMSWGVDQVQVQRLMTAKDETAARKSVLYLLIINVPRFAVLVLMGLAIYAFYQAFPERLSDEILQRPDKILPFFVMHEVPIGISGIIIAAIFAASMSSFDSGLNCIVATITIDWYKRIIRPGQDDKKYLAFAKILTMVIGIAIMLFAIMIYSAGIKSIIDTSNKYIGLLFGPIIAIFMLGAFSRRAKQLPTIIGGVISIAVVLIIDFVSQSRVSAGQGPILSIYMYGPVTVSITMLMGYLGSFLGRQLPYEEIAKFTLAKKK